MVWKLENPPIGVEVEVLLVAGDPVLDRMVRTRELSEIELRQS